MIEFVFVIFMLVWVVDCFYVQPLKIKEEVRQQYQPYYDFIESLPKKFKDEQEKSN